MTGSGRGSIPVIDMEDSPAEEMVAACREWGCFRVVNHGVPLQLMAEMKAVARSLLNLPLEVKERTSHPVGGMGYVPVNQASPVFESMGCFDFASPGNFKAFFDKLGASPHQRETIVKYSEAVHALAFQMGRRLAEGMGVSVDLFTGWQCQFRMNKYNYTPDFIGSLGVALHTDPGFLTVLQDDEDIGGLEAQHKETGLFAPLDPMPGSFVINLGDVAQIWSNGRLSSMRHQVQCRAGTPRLSIACFVLGPKDGPLEPAPELVDAEYPLLYTPVTFEEYRMLRNRAGLGSCVCELLRIPSNS